MPNQSLVVPRPPRPWLQKFRDAMRGVKTAVRGEVSYFVHFFVTAGVAIAAGVFECTVTEWLLLALCVATVLTAETFNTALERLSRAVTSDADPNVRDALDMASGAVLLASIGAAAIGVAILGPRLWESL